MNDLEMLNKKTKTVHKTLKKVSPVTFARTPPYIVRANSSEAIRRHETECFESRVPVYTCKTAFGEVSVFNRVLRIPHINLLDALIIVNEGVSIKEMGSSKIFYCRKPSLYKICQLMDIKDTGNNRFTIKNLLFDLMDARISVYDDKTQTEKTFNIISSVYTSNGIGLRTESAFCSNKALEGILLNEENFLQNRSDALSLLSQAEFDLKQALDKGNDTAKLIKRIENIKRKESLYLNDTILSARESLILEIESINQKGISDSAKEKELKAAKKKTFDRVRKVGLTAAGEIEVVCFTPEFINNFYEKDPRYLTEKEMLTLGKLSNEGAVLARHMLTHEIDFELNTTLKDFYEQFIKCEFSGTVTHYKQYKNLKNDLPKLEELFGIYVDEKKNRIKRRVFDI